MNATPTPPRWSELPSGVLEKVAAILESKYPPATVESGEIDEKELRALIYRAGQHSVVRDVRAALKTREKAAHG